jgi:predicted permease
MARAAIPAALFGLGGVLMQYRPEGDMRAILFVVALSLIVHPIIVWTIGSSVNLDRDAFRSAIMTASMAPGINAYVFANMYAAARRVAASSVLIATGSSIITIWLWLLILP